MHDLRQAGLDKQASAGDIDGGDCFHPSITGQNTAADLAWTNNPDR